MPLSMSFLVAVQPSEHISGCIHILGVRGFLYGGMSKNNMALKARLVVYLEMQFPLKFSRFLVYSCI